MLKFMRRNAASTWVKAMFLAIVLVFIFWGFAGSFRDQGAQAVATVNGETIEPVTYYRAYNNLVRAYRDAYKDAMNPELLKTLGLERRALDQLVQANLLRQEAERIGLRTSEEEVRTTIAAIPAFKGEGGHFDKDLYVRVLRANSLSPAEFEEAQREELLVRKLQELVLAGVNVGEADVRDQYHFDNDQVDLRVVKFDPAAYTGAITLTDADVQQYYDGHTEELREPERAKIEYVVYGPEAFAGKVQISDADVQQYYDANKGQFTSPEQARTKPLDEVRAEIVTTLTEGKARDLARTQAGADRDKVAGGEALGTVAHASGLSVQTPAPFGITESIDGLGRVSELTDAAFATSAGQVGPVVSTGKGFVVFRETERIAPRVPPLAEIRDRVVTAATRERAAAVAKTKAAEARGALQQSKDIDAVARTYGRPVDDTGLFSRRGPLVPNLGSAPELKKAAFVLTPENPVAPGEYGVGEVTVIAILKSRQPADEAKFAAEKDTLIASAATQRQNQALQQFLDRLKAGAAVTVDEVFMARVADSGVPANGL